MWYEIRHSCGHQGRAYLAGPPDIIDASRSNLESMPCYRCRTDRIMGGALPRLVGTPAEVQRATEIRFAHLPSLTTEQLANTDARWWIEHEAGLRPTIGQEYP